MTRQIIRLLVAGALAAATLAGCAATALSAGPAPEGESPSATTQATEPTRTTSSHHPTHPTDGESAPAAGCTNDSTTEPATDPGPDLPLVEVDVQLLDGTVEPAPARIDIPLGSTVVLRAEVDTAAEIHVHGYDVAADAEPGEPVCLEVLADTPGVFDVEAHPETLLLQLAVR